MMETTTYEIKTYEPEFFDEEVKLTQDFQQRKQLDPLYLTLDTETQVNNLKNYRENGAPNFPFVPTDHWYLFDETDGMVGHIHAFPQQNTKRCVVSAIVTRAGHEQGEEILFNTLVESVKERGYDTLVMNSTEDQVIEQEFLDQFDFEKKNIRNLRANVPREALQVEMNDTYTLIPFDDEQHREEVITELYLPKGYKRPQLDTQFDNLKTAVDNGNVPSWVVATQDDEIIGQSIAFYGRQHLKHIVQFNTVTTNLEGEDSLPLINAIYSYHLDKLPESVTHIEHFLFGQVLDLRSLYESIGFEYLENHLYEKKI